jgi:hypothetical protein
MTVAAAHRMYIGVHLNGPSLLAGVAEEAARVSAVAAWGEAAAPALPVSAATRDAVGLCRAVALGRALGLRKRASGSLLAVTPPAPSARATAVGLAVVVGEGLPDEGSVEGLDGAGAPEPTTGSGVGLGCGVETGLGLGVGWG